MTQHIEPTEIITIGYPNFAIVADHMKATETYIRKFDIVIPVDGSLVLPELITKYMLDIESEGVLFRYLDEHTRTFEDLKVSIQNGR